MRIASALLLALIGTACVPRAEIPERLAQGEWRFVSIDGDTPAVPDRATLVFDGDRMAANVGCNAIAGEWRVEEERLIAGPLVGTEMFCEGTVWEQEQAISALLVAAPTIEWRDRTLVLQSSGHEAQLEPVEPQP